MAKKKPTTKNKTKSKRRAIGDPILQQMIDEALVHAKGLRAHGDVLNAQVQERLANRLRSDANLRGLICKERQMLRTVTAAKDMWQHCKDAAAEHHDEHMWAFEEARILDERSKATYNQSQDYAHDLGVLARSLACDIAELTLLLEQTKQEQLDVARHADRQYDAAQAQRQAMLDGQYHHRQTYKLLYGKTEAAARKLELEQKRLTACATQLSQVMTKTAEQDTRSVVHAMRLEAEAKEREAKAALLKRACSLGTTVEELLTAEGETDG
jgi:hypothetical protein